MPSIAELTGASGITKVQVELVHLLEQEKLGATPYVYPVAASIVGGTTHPNSKKPDMSKQVFKLTRIIQGQNFNDNELMFKLIVDGRIIIPRQYLTHANGNIILPTPVLVWTDLATIVENTTANTIAYDCVLLYTIYDRVAVNRLKEQLGI